MPEEIEAAAATNASTDAGGAAPVGSAPASDTAVPDAGEPAQSGEASGLSGFGLDGEDDEGGAESGSTGDNPGEEKHEGAPEKYDFGEFEKSAPEMMGAFAEAAKELNLTQAQADSLIGKVAPKLQARDEAYLKRAAEEWEQRAVNDAEYGGAKLAQSLPVAKRAYRQFASPALREEFKKAGLDRHPEVIRLFLHVGQAVSGDVAVQGEPRKGPDLNDARTMYPNSRLNR